MTIIFQDNIFISLKCSNGEWSEVIRKEVAEVFQGLPRQAPDSVLIRSNDGQPMVLGTMFVFFGPNFYECSATGNDVS